MALPEIARSLVIQLLVKPQALEARNIAALQTTRRVDARFHRMPLRIQRLEERNQRLTRLLKQLAHSSPLLYRRVVPFVGGEK